MVCTIEWRLVNPVSEDLDETVFLHRPCGHDQRRDSGTDWRSGTELTARDTSGWPATDRAPLSVEKLSIEKLSPDETTTH